MRLHHEAFNLTQVTVTTAVETVAEYGQNASMAIKMARREMKILAE